MGSDNAEWPLQLADIGIFAVVLIGVFVIKRRQSVRVPTASFADLDKVSVKPSPKGGAFPKAVSKGESASEGTRSFGGTPVCAGVDKSTKTTEETLCARNTTPSVKAAFLHRGLGTEGDLQFVKQGSERDRLIGSEIYGVRKSHGPGKRFDQFL